MSLQWLNQCKCEAGNHNTVRGNCIARNIVGKICDDCAKKCSGLTQYALDAALVVPAEQLSGSVIVPTGEVDTQPRQ